MAEDLDLGAKTEPPTPRRRQQAWDEGRYAFSSELTTGFLLILGIGGLVFLAPRLGSNLLEQTRTGLLDIGQRDLSVELTEHIFITMFAKLMLITGAIAGLLFAGSIAINVAQAGLRFSPDKLGVDFEKVGFQWSRLFSLAKLMAALFLSVKVVAVGTVAWWILRQRGGEIIQLSQMPLSVALTQSWALILHLALWSTGTLFVIGAVDYGYQRWQFEKSLYMTKQELKEEIKRDEGDPQIKARIRKMQRDGAQRKMFQAVPKATVVVTNPTHLAVALRYDPKTMTAPKVIAKGAGHIAKKIVEIARQHGIPTLERKPIARALYKAVKIDREVPFGLYFVVAELLAHVYRLKGMNGTNRPPE